MLNRRHIRTKVMQTIFEMTHTNNDDLNLAYKALNNSSSSMYDLYLLQYQLFVVILQKARKLNKATQQSFLKENQKQN
ncbi:MAG: antitermination protein NusB, partial [Flavobacteriaceae bacterium]